MNFGLNGVICDLYLLTTKFTIVRLKKCMQKLNGIYLRSGKKARVYSSDRRDNIVNNTIFYI